MSFCCTETGWGSSVFCLPGLPLMFYLLGIIIKWLCFETVRVDDSTSSSSCSSHLLTIMHHHHYYQHHRRHSSQNGHTRLLQRFCPWASTIRRQKCKEKNGIYVYYLQVLNLDTNMLSAPSHAQITDLHMYFAIILKYTWQRIPSVFSRPCLIQLLRRILQMIFFYTLYIKNYLKSL